jgi:hypothetical protein
MQLAAPSLPLNASQSSAANGKDDSLSSLLTGSNQKKASSSFEELLTDSKSAAPASDNDKAKNPADDRATAESAVIFSGWMQTPLPAETKPVALAAQPTTDAASEVAATTTDLPANCANAATATFGASAGVNANANAAVTATTKAAPTVLSVKSLPSFASRFSAATTDESATSATQVDAAALTGVSAKASDPTTSPVTAAAVATDQAVAADLTAAAEASVVTSAVPAALAAKTSIGKVASAVKSVGEKIAPTSVDLAKGLKTDSVPADKNFLDADKEEVKDDLPSVGIDAAKPTDTMAATFSHRSLSPANDRSMLTAFSTDASSATSETTATSAAADAHRAVDAVLSASERLTTSGQGVNLQFSLGGADLAVRVEMRAGELHATFRTNSPELRAALSNEWQAAAAQDAASPLRMVEPVFAAANSSNAGDFSQSASSQQRDASSRETAPGSTSFSRSLGREEASDDSSSSQEQRQPRSFFGANQHLHAFA